MAVIIPALNIQEGNKGRSAAEMEYSFYPGMLGVS